MISSTPWKYASYGAPMYWWIAIQPDARPLPVESAMSSAADARTSIGNSGGNGSDETSRPTRSSASGTRSNGMPYSISTNRTRRTLEKIRSLRSINSRSLAAEVTAFAIFGASFG